MNVQYAIKDEMVYVLEVNPRASRTVPYVSKATGVPLARCIAARVTAGSAGRAGADRGAAQWMASLSKKRVLPFKKFLGVDAILGPKCAAPAR